MKTFTREFESQLEHNRTIGELIALVFGSHEGFEMEGVGDLLIITAPNGERQQGYWNSDAPRYISIGLWTTWLLDVKQMSNESEE